MIILKLTEIPNKNVPSLEQGLVDQVMGSEQRRGLHSQELQSWIQPSQR